MELRDNVTERERFYIEAQFRAHHYLSHAYEGSKTPDKAWHSNARYAGLVFNIPHALHMPGHIYAQSDRIEGAISAFSAGRGCGAEVDRVRLALPEGHHGHNVHFLITRSTSAAGTTTR